MPAPSGGSSSQSSSGNPPSAALSPPAPAIAPALLEPAAASTPSESPEVIVAKDTIPPAAPLLDSFFYDAIFTTSSLNNIFGAHSTDTAKIQMYFSSSADVAGAPAGSQPAVTSSVDWKFPVSLNSGYNYYYFTATDDAGNTSTLSSRALLVLDTIAPPVPLVTVTDQTSASSTNLHIELAGGDLLSPITFYELDYRTSTDWISLVSGATSTSFDIPGVRGREYSFRARARDILGNTSEWSMATRQCAAGSCVDSAAPVFINWSGEVVINEIAWAGTSADYSRDEWLELYNTTNQPIDLKAWKIMVSGEPINFSRIINAVIPARGYFLLERGYDENIREVPADIIYTLSGGFKNSGEKIELLKPGGEKADEVDNSGGWSAGDNKRYRTMERINPLRPGNDRYNWQSNAGQRMGPRTYNGGQIYGSPKQPNFGFIALTEQQEDVNRVLRAADSPYVLGYYEIPAGYTLTVEPGVVIKSYYPVAGMNIYGTLVTLGAASSSITFTSGRDQDFATARDATVVGTGWKDGASPQVKDWQGLWFRPGSTGNLSGLTLRFAAKDFRPANSGVWSPGVWQGLRANSANLTITDSVLMNNGAVYLSNSSTTIKNTVFSIGERAVEADGGSLSLENSDFSAFTNASGPIYAKNLWPALVRLSFRDNGFNAPLLELVSVNVSTTIKRGESVILSSLITVNKGATLTIEPGAKLYMGSYSILEVNGTLEAVGTAAEPIIITPFAAGEQWSHIVFNHSTSTLRHVAVSGGNKHLRHYTTTDGALLVNDSFVTLSDCSVMDSREPGDSIRTSASRLVMSNCSLGHSQRSKFDTVGITAVGGEVSLDAVRFNNLTVGLFGEDANQPPRVGLDNIFRSSFTNVDTIFVGLDWLTPLLAP
ncbi:MAG: lamin tail domain-containing protein [Candidatus Magasanikbacteria bacterium]|nr:lamin tail domain-containing protein [Candidatus Magasanikbacteria bacterium]